MKGFARRLLKDIFILLEDDPFQLVGLLAYKLEALTREIRVRVHILQLKSQ